MENTKSELQLLMNVIVGNDFEYDFECYDSFYPSFEIIIHEVFNVTYSDVRSQSRKSNVVFARYMIFDYLLRHTGALYEQIGEIYNKDHASITTSKRSHTELVISNYKNYRDLYNSFKYQLNLENK